MNNNKENFSINFTELRSMFELKNRKDFELYLETIFKDFSSVMENGELGISKNQFMCYLKFPIFISDFRFVFSTLKNLEIQIFRPQKCLFRF